MVAFLHGDLVKAKDNANSPDESLITKYIYKDCAYKVNCFLIELNKVTLFTTGGAQWSANLFELLHPEQSPERHDFKIGDQVYFLNDIFRYTIVEIDGKFARFSNETVWYKVSDLKHVPKFHVGDIVHRKILPILNPNPMPYKIVALGIKDAKVEIYQPDPIYININDLELVK